MKKILYAWIEQIVSFDTEEEFTRWLDRKVRKNVKNQDIRTYEEGISDKDGRFYIRIKFPYNTNEMEVNVNEFFKELEITDD